MSDSVPPPVKESACIICKYAVPLALAAAVIAIVYFYTKNNAENK